MWLILYKYTSPKDYNRI
uniref:Uncharacterized protein n=1 Tax=Rhizophora mucronata TaxID=61149 RepID=A0A2P2PF27_RHIMU